MLADGELSMLLSETDLAELPVGIRSKVETHISHLRRMQDDILQNVETLRTETDTARDEIKNCNLNAQSLEKRIEKLMDENAKKDKQLEEYCKENQDLKDKFCQLDSELTEVTASKNELTRKVCSLEAEKVELCAIVDRNSRSSVQLHSELRQCMDQLETTKRSKCDALVRLEAIEGREASVEARERRMEMEREMLGRQLQVSKEQLAQYMQEEACTRRESSRQLVEMQMKYDQQSDQIVILRNEKEEMNLQIGNLNQKLAQCSERLKEQRESECELENNYRNQLDAQSRLVDLYKNGISDANARCDTLKQNVEKLTALLEVAEKHHKEQEEHIHLSEMSHASELQDKAASIEDLNEQLRNKEEHIQSLIKQNYIADGSISELSPSAAQLCKSMTSSGGRTLSEIVGELHTAKLERATALTECKQLRLYLDEVLKQVEDRAPLIQRLRADYQAALATIDTLTASSDATQSEFDTVKADRARLSAEHERLSQSNTDFSVRCADLSNQVCVLLAELEEVKGRLVIKDISAEVQSNHVSDTLDKRLQASETVPSNLITFKSIEELQHKNEELLLLVRKLSGSHFDEDSKLGTTNNNTHSDNEFKAEIMSLQRELDHVRASIKQQKDHVTSIIKQRDMYRALLNEQTIEKQTDVDKESVCEERNTNAQVDGSTAKYSKLDKLTDAMNELREEYSVYKNEQNANVKMLNEQIKSQNELLLEHRTRNAKLLAKLESSEQRFTLLEQNNLQYRRQMTSVEEKYKVTQALNAKYEETISGLRENALCLQQQLCCLQSRYDSLHEEKCLLRESESRMSVELEALRREKTSASSLLVNLESIKTSLEHTNKTTLENYETQVNILKREVSTLVMKMQHESDLHEETERNLESEIQKMANSFENEKLLKEKTICEHNQLKEQLESCEKELISLKNSIEETNSTKSRNLDASFTFGEYKTVREELMKARNELETANYKLILAEEQKNRHAEMAETAQTRLSEVEEVLNDLQTNLTLKLKEIEDLTCLKALLDDSRQENERLTLQLSNAVPLDQVESMKTQLAELNHQQQMLEESKQIEKTLRYDLNERQKCLSEAESKYERELQLHAADITEMSRLRQQLLSVQATLDSYVEKQTAAENSHKLNEENWLKHKAEMQECVRVSNDKQKELISQNEALMDQLDAIGLRLKKYVNHDVSTAIACNTGDSQSDRISSSSSSQLMEIIRHVRQQRSIAETRAEASDTEVCRLRASERHLREQLARAESRCEAGVEHAPDKLVCAESVAKHTQLLHKLETLSALTDSNRLLRQERDQCALQIKRLEATVSQMQQAIQPLEEAKVQNEARVNILENEVSVCNMECDRWKNRVAELTDKFSLVNPNEISLLNERNDGLTCKVADLEKELEVNKNRYNQCEDDLNEASSKLECLEAENFALHDKIKDKCSECNDLKQKHEKYTDELSTLTDKISSLESKHSSMTIACNDTQSKLDLLQEECNGLRDQLQTLQEENDSLKNSVEQYDVRVTERDATIVDLRRSIVQIRKIGRKYKTQFEEVQEEQTNLGQQLQSAREELETQTNVAKQHEEKTKIVLQKFKQKISQLTSENRELRDSREQGVEMALASGDSDGSESEMRLAAFKSAYENRLSKMEEELRAARNSNELNQKQVDSLLKHIALMERQTGQLNITSTSTFSVSATAYSSTTTLPPLTTSDESRAETRTPTANIRPLSATSSTQSLPAAYTVSHTVPHTAASPAACVSPSSQPATAASVSVSALISSTSVCPSTCRITPTASIRPVQQKSSSVVTQQHVTGSAITDTSPESIIVAAVAPTSQMALVSTSRSGLGLHNSHVSEHACSVLGDFRVSDGSSADPEDSVPNSSDIGPTRQRDLQADQVEEAVMEQGDLEGRHRQLEMPETQGADTEESGRRESEEGTDCSGGHSSHHEPSTSATCSHKRQLCTLSCHESASDQSIEIQNTTLTPSFSIDTQPKRICLQMDVSRDCSSSVASTSQHVEDDEDLSCDGFVRATVSSSEVELTPYHTRPDTSSNQNSLFPESTNDNLTTENVSDDDCSSQSSDVICLGSDQEANEDNEVDEIYGDIRITEDAYSDQIEAEHISSMHIPNDYNTNNTTWINDLISSSSSINHDDDMVTNNNRSHMLARTNNEVIMSRAGVANNMQHSGRNITDPLGRGFRQLQRARRSRGH